MTLSELATLALATLDAQRKYFKSRRREDLIESKRMEKELRKASVEVLGKHRATICGKLVQMIFHDGIGRCTLTEGHEGKCYSQMS